MTGPAQAFEVVRVICTPIGFGSDVVDGRGGCDPALTRALLAQVLVTREDHRSEFVPTGAIPALMSRLSALVLLPPFITVRLAVT